MKIKPSDVEKVIELFQAQGWKELHLELDGLHLYLSTDPLSRSPSAMVGSAREAPEPVTDRQAAAPALAPGPAKGGTSKDVETDTPEHWVAITAPNLGTFYRSPKPGEAPYVEVGQSVEPESEICLIEVMKLFTTLRADVRGVVRRICVEDAEMVEFGQVLFYIEPV